ncbi:3-beta hydroxysteroid dehydrogenase [Aliidongia dinghuensis]|uniref:3-beta hydroxysteroid dehydrogenase n=1 Tax=Aliidongia dinghuensis TaxID=1867774 RepID=A0A8J2YRF2_9PROT|nr:SDR family oxidoreductase [Aliidongia dinghuensis]GGF11966.1 3-beta hydroxysteroid dehydrogenase [Aliidongia dinghuensis]
MHVFVTGATGWIGSAVVEELLSAGHNVSGLTTSAAGAQKLQKMGAKAYVGKLGQHDLLRKSAAESDGVIHTAFIHGLSSMSLGMRVRLFAGALNGGIVSSFMRILAETESGAIGALGSGLENSGRPLVVASGILYLPQGKVATEKDSHVSNVPNRSFSERAAFNFIQRGVRASAVRLAPTVHGDGDHGFIPHIVQAARKNGVSPYIGDGANRWTAVHRLDAAKLFRLALEKGEAGAKYHGVGEAGIPFQDIASLIATRLNVPAVSIPTSKAAKHFGMLGGFIGLDNPASNEWTRQTLGWNPEQRGLFADMDAHYFNSAAK